MGVVETVLGILLLVMALFLTAAVLMQSGKDKHLSGAIAGGADTFFSKSKANTLDKILDRVTVVVAILFAVICLVMYLFVI